MQPFLRLSKDHPTGNRLHQEPAQELEQLRTEPSAHLPSLPIPAGRGVPLPGVTGPSLDVSLRLKRGQSAQAGLLLRPWLRADSADAEPTAAALVVDWESQSLEVRTYANPLMNWKIDSQLISTPQPRMFLGFLFIACQGLSCQHMLKRTDLVQLQVEVNSVPVRQCVHPGMRRSASPHSWTPAPMPLAGEAL